MTHLAQPQSEPVMSSHSELTIEDVMPVIDDIIAHKRGERGLSSQFYKRPKIS